MSDKKDAEDCTSEEASSQAESYDANKSGTSETYDMKDFCPGIRIEAKDFDGKWYPAKVSDVDWTENEILVHFENWNTKFDEWIPMDSSRLRSLQKPVHQQKEHVKFSKGEEVMAMWSPYQKYPATIQAVLANDRYDVLFYDGFLKRLKSHKISKIEGQTVKTEVKNFSDIGTKEERRERKRKINVAELFHINKRSRKKGLVHSKTQDIKTYPVSKSKNKGAVIKKPVVTDENNEHVSSVESNGIKQKEDKIQNAGTPASTKALIDTIPAAFEVKYLNGQTERWSKQLYQRSEGRTAGKLDIVILNPQGRKFRSRNEIMKYCEENGIIYSHEAFDFSAKGRPKSKSSLQIPSTKIDAPNIEAKDKASVKKSQRKSLLDTPVEPQQPFTALNSSEILTPDSNGQNKVFIGEYEVAIENGKFICPVKICAKHFRRENLLHMHMKHYHPEFSKYLDYTPSVTDLAYARTVGGLDVSDVSSPAPRKLPEKTEKPSGKAENVRKSSDTFAEYPKEAKKLKLDTRLDGKPYPIKGRSEPSMASDVAENSTDENQKSKISLNTISSPTSTSNENDSSTLERNVNTSESNVTEPIVPENKNAVSSHNVMKSLRHRLNGRKKNSRFQGSFAEHMRKKRLIGQDHSRSQNRIGRQQQSQHLRHQLQQSLPPQTTLASQPCVEDVNSNGSSQFHNLSRYPKPHLNVSNEIPGKNNLLTSTKTISPVKGNVNRKRKRCVEYNDSNSSGDSDEFSKEREVFPDENRCNSIVGTTKSYNKRRFLTGLLNARKRARSNYGIRRKKKKRMGCTRSSEFSWKPTLGNAGPDRLDNTLNVDDELNLKETKESKNENCIYHQNFSQHENDQMFKKIIKVRLKRNVNGEIKLVNDELGTHDGRRVENNCAEGTVYAADEVRNGPKAGNVLENKNLLEEESQKTDGVIGTEMNSANLPPTTTVDEIDECDSMTSLEKESQKNVGLEDGFKADAIQLPKSYVLLENVCRKAIYNKYCNKSVRGNDENVSGQKEKRSNRSKRKRETGRHKKRVRFENTVMQKWINTDESDDQCQFKLNEGRREDRKKKLTKGQPVDDLIEREVNQVKWSDDNSRDEKTLRQINSGLDNIEGTEDSKSALVLENSKLEKLRRNEIINCLCGITEEDGLMIQCDLCLCWQHGHCAGIFRESDVPDKYTCAICKNPYRARSSMKYLHDQEWLKEGTLPSLSFRSKRDDIITQRRTILKRSHDLSGSIALLARVIHSLRLKVNIAEKKDHPKLWLWAKKWTEKKPNRLKDESDLKEEKLDQSIDSSNGVKKEECLVEDEKQLPKAPEPEAPIDSAECKLNLLDHLIHYQTLIDARLSCIESLVAELESMQDDAVNDEAPDRYPRTKATVQMLLRDLNTMRKIAII